MIAKQYATGDNKAILNLEKMRQRCVKQYAASGYKQYAADC